MALDSNVLIYAELEPESDKGRRAHWLIESVAARGVIPVQVLLEFLNVIRRKRPQSLASAVTKVEDWRRVFSVVATTDEVLAAAIQLSRDHRLQIWDAVVWCATRAAGANILFTEDMHDGLTLLGVRAVNPFARSRDELEAFLPTAP
ncbi:MAG TPA: PIN domain-containing protein [Caulobacteraceae bacterium]